MSGLKTALQHSSFNGCRWWLVLNATENKKTKDTAPYNIPGAVQVSGSPEISNQIENMTMTMTEFSFWGELFL